jgi:hypothetical protein
MLVRYQQSPGIEFAPLKDEVLLFHRRATSSVCSTTRRLHLSGEAAASCEEITDAWARASTVWSFNRQCPT